MKRIIISLLFLMLLCPLSGTGQTTAWKWSIKKCVAEQPADSAFLVDSEKKMWQASLSGECPVFMGMFGGHGYNMRITKAEALDRFSDTTVAKLHFANAWELATYWNAAADTFSVISYEPSCGIGINTLGAKTVWDFETFCWAHIPLFYYQKQLETRGMSRYWNLTLNSLAESFNAELSGDTLYRTIEFTDDSNYYLPQATFTHFGQEMKNCMMYGSLFCHFKKTLGPKMSKWQLESQFVHWDSTNHVEDPNNPGTFIFAPIKIEEQPVGVVLYEKWIPVYSDLVQPERKYFVPYVTYSRVVLSYGLKLTTGKIIWTDPAQCKLAMTAPAFNWAPYEESFRAERYETMHIALEP